MDHRINSQSKTSSHVINFQVQLIANDSAEERAIENFQLIVNKGHQVATDDQLGLIENYVYSKFNNNHQAVVSINPTGSGTTIVNVMVQTTTGIGGL